MRRIRSFFRLPDRLPLAPCRRPDPVYFRFMPRNRTAPPFRVTITAPPLRVADLTPEQRARLEGQRRSAGGRPPLRAIRRLLPVRRLSFKLITDGQQARREGAPLWGLSPHRKRQNQIVAGSSPLYCQLATKAREGRVCHDFARLQTEERRLIASLYTV